MDGSKIVGQLEELHGLSVKQLHKCEWRDLYRIALFCGASKEQIKHVTTGKAPNEDTSPQLARLIYNMLHSQKFPGVNTQSQIIDLCKRIADIPKQNELNNVLIELHKLLTFELGLSMASCEG